MTRCVSRNQGLNVYMYCTLKYRNLSRQRRWQAPMLSMWSQRKSVPDRLWERNADYPDLLKSAAAVDSSFPVKPRLRICCAPQQPSLHREHGSLGLADVRGQRWSFKQFYPNQEKYGVNGKSTSAMLCIFHADFKNQLKLLYLYMVDID